MIFGEGRGSSGPSVGAKGTDGGRARRYHDGMELIDTHCHLYSDPLATAAGDVLDRARARGVRCVVVPAYDAASWATTADLARRPGVFAAFGIHPWLAHDLDTQGAAAAALSEGPPGGAPPIRTASSSAGGASDHSPGGGPVAPQSPAELRTALAVRLQSTADAPRPVAVGEIGLDTKIDTSGLDQQLPLLRMQLELAVDHDLPAILHCRGAFPELLTEVKRFGGRLRGVLHAFARGPELARDFTAAGLHLGLGGAVTRDRARRVRKAVAQIPLDRMVLETDAPSIGLEGVLPQDTEPQHVADVAAAVAGLRGVTVEEIAAATTANAVDLFRLTSV